ncbi:MAG: DUF4372 domain-containing protein [Candidatus Marinimicrobia bacterium]|nr:DUF4372 domain-containing protein [Candidatus Neomarinimicrobiota bacterium]
MSELLRLFPRYEFEKLENRYNANHYARCFGGWQQLLVLLFAQAGRKDSLRDIETSLSVHHSKWYHIRLYGIKCSTPFGLIPVEDARDTSALQLIITQPTHSNM